MLPDAPLSLDGEDLAVIVSSDAEHLHRLPFLLHLHDGADGTRFSLARGSAGDRRGRGAVEGRGRLRLGRLPPTSCAETEPCCAPKLRVLPTSAGFRRRGGPAQPARNQVDYLGSIMVELIVAGGAAAVGRSF